MPIIDIQSYIKDRMEEIAVEGFMLIQNLGDIQKLISVSLKINASTEHCA